MSVNQSTQKFIWHLFSKLIFIICCEKNDNLFIKENNSHFYLDFQI